MTYALIAISSSALTAYILTPPMGDGGYQAGSALICILAGLAAFILESIKS